jgi:ubiquinone/menaquinone biosynthesis C-methylase UbiE
MPDALSTSDLRKRWRERTLPRLRGVVLDIGAGSGVAADHLAPEAEWLTLEPRRWIGRSPTERVEERPGARLLAAPAEAVPLETGSVDAVIASTALCSVRRPVLALAEIVRVLRPGGTLVFFEHVAADRGTWSSLLQTAYAPVSRWLDHGCDPHRDTERLIRAAGFAGVSVRRTEVAGALGTIEPLIDGTAIR